ncbi:zinc finger BED domain-containing protein 4-like [Octopus sinensis]|uniref:Zinc finger BED domain-containing protein 4-like n=1 Tax=Octopus sinensis TaxID=2607531 RepID=A0A6P7U794_9MOLL|nr:zinc finger BED domain-containing protein 4-like [Octopus sinensis]XP_029656851.1 zinc finger BED domain-containing protein 4-like [Octopus sinensis]
MIAGVRKSGIESQSCFLHSLQLSINESIFSQEDVKNIISTSRDIVSHFNHSALAISKLTNLQTQLNLPVHKLKQDINIRWNSTYYMLSRVIEQRKAPVTYAIDNNLSILSDIQWITAEKIVKILKPFEEITIEASKRSATASMIIPSIKTILLFLEKAKESCEFYEIKETIEKLMSSIDKRFTFYFENESLCITTTLDPRFKTRFHKTCMIERI